MIIDANTGAVLINDKGDELRHPASLTKMMTLYLTFETLQSGRLSFSSPVHVSETAAAAPPSNLDLEAGDEITAGDAVRALITKSANDVAVALAEKIGGSHANFVRLMNAKAKVLGMSNTNFENASGLPDPDQVTTARDMITLGLRLQDDFPQHYPLFATRTFRYKGASLRNHNTLMNHFAGIDGIKTGYTRASGFNLVSSVRRGGRHLVGAVFGGSSAASRNSQMRTLLTRAMARASPVKTRKPAPMMISKLKSEPKIAARPAPKPKPAPVAVAPVRMAAAPEPQPTPKPAPAAMPVPAPAPKAAVPAAPQEPPTVETATDANSAPVAAPEALAAVTAAPAPAPLEITRVRRVMVEPRPKVARPKPNPDETTDMAPDEEAPLVSETIIAKNTPPPSPEYDGAQMSMLGANDVVPPEPAAEPAPVSESVPQIMPEPVPAAPIVAVDTPSTRPAAAKPAALGAKLVTASLTKPVLAAQRPRSAPSKEAIAPLQRGMPPSSLEAQAAALRSAPGQRMAALQPQAATAAPPTGSGRFEIQIGAYASVDEAQRSLNAAQARTGGLLAGHASVTQPVAKAGRQVFRARFRGFDAASAAAACQRLRAQSFDCFVMSAE